MSPSASSSSQDQQSQQSQHLPKSVIPTQPHVTEQLTKNWAPFKVLRQRYAGTRFEEQRQLHLPQKHKTTVADSTLRMEMNGLEDNVKARELAKCACKKFCMDFHDDHTSTCTAHSGATKAHDWMVSVLWPLSVRPDTWSEHSTASRSAQVNGVAMWR